MLHSLSQQSLRQNSAPNTAPHSLSNTDKALREVPPAVLQINRGTAGQGQLHPEMQAIVSLQTLDQAVEVP
jgi:hypothetical protein